MTFTVEIMTHRGPMAGRWQPMARFDTKEKAQEFIAYHKKMDSTPPTGKYSYRTTSRV